MENTGKVRFRDNQAHWYVAQGSNWMGALAAAEVYEKIRLGEVSLADYIWKPGMSGWKRICEVNVFQVLTPEKPKKNLLEQVRKAQQSKSPAIPPEIQTKVWFLHYNETQFGPFSEDEVIRFLKVGRIHGRVHAWTEDFSEWRRLEKIDLFQKYCKIQKKAPRSKKLKVPGGSANESRMSPRKPLVARIVMANENQVMVGVCRDISVGGMQVLTHQIPGKPGARLRLNVSPSGESKAIQPFVADGVIVRILEDGLGFSFRFYKLPETTRDAIVSYIDG